jgi:hypothetical protein
MRRGPGIRDWCTRRAFGQRCGEHAGGGVVVVVEPVATASDQGRALEEGLHTICMRSALPLHTQELRC